MPQHAITAELGCSENAVRVAQHSAYKKLGVTNSAKLMALVIEALMPVDEV
jgi:DNA-binding NarL/FixJ family response regulator